MGRASRRKRYARLETKRMKSYPVADDYIGPALPLTLAFFSWIFIMVVIALGALAF